MIYLKSHSFEPKQKKEEVVVVENNIPKDIFSPINIQKLLSMIEIALGDAIDKAIDVALKEGKDEPNIFHILEMNIREIEFDNDGQISLIGVGITWQDEYTDLSNPNLVQVFLSEDAPIKFQEQRIFTWKELKLLAQIYKS